MKTSLLARMLLMSLCLSSLFFSCNKDEFKPDAVLDEPLNTLNSEILDDEPFTGTVIDFPLETPSTETIEHEPLVQLKTPFKLDVDLRERVITQARSRRSRRINGVAGEEENVIETRSSCSSGFFIFPRSRSYYGFTGQDYENLGSRKTGSYDDNHYDRYNLKTDLEGDETVYYLDVKSERNYTFKLSGHRNDLAMILLKASDSSDLGCSTSSDGFLVNVTEPGEKLVAFTTAKRNRSKTFGAIRLKKGLYFLIIDSKKGRGSSFYLRVSSQGADESCDHRDIFYDKFAKYSTGYLSNQSVYWEKWYPQAKYDAEVIQTDYRYQGGRLGPVMKISRKSNTYNDHQPNVLLCTGVRDEGRYKMTFLLGIPRGRSGYFNIQRTLEEQNQGNRRGAEFHFYGNGSGEIKLPFGGTKKFHYKVGYWVEVYLEFDFHRGKAEFGIDNQRIHDWGIRNESLEALNFYARYNNSKYYVDRVCFTRK